MSEPNAIDPETLSLEELRAQILAAPPEEEVKPEVKPEVKAAEAAPVVEEVEEEEPEEIIFERSIDLGDGSGVQVFRGRGASEVEALRALNDKLYDAQVSASKKINELGKKVKVEDTRTEQQKADDDYVISQRLQKEPGKTIAELVDQRIRERDAITRRELASQQNFVNTHPDYEANPENGQAMLEEAQRLGYTECTEEALEKAYQSLSKRGLRSTKREEADGSTATEVKATERIAQPKTEVTQIRSPKKSSSVRATGGAPVVKTEPSLDEAETMPMDQLRELARKAFLASQQAE